MASVPHSATVQDNRPKPMAKFAGQNSTLETVNSNLAAEGEMFRRCRVKLDAAQRDVAECAFITHTTLGEIEAGLSRNGQHIQNVRKSLLRIAAAKQQNISEVIRELAG